MDRILRFFNFGLFSMYIKIQISITVFLKLRICQILLLPINVRNLSEKTVIEI